jgi:hypothetical protein
VRVARWEESDIPVIREDIVILKTTRISISFEKEMGVSTTSTVARLGGTRSTTT